MKKNIKISLLCLFLLGHLQETRPSLMDVYSRMAHRSPQLTLVLSTAALAATCCMARRASARVARFIQENKDDVVPTLSLVVGVIFACSYNRLLKTV